MLSQPFSALLDNVSRADQPLDDLARAALRVQHARRDAARWEAELDALLFAARRAGVPYRTIARELLVAWRLAPSADALRRFTEVVRKRLSRTARPVDQLARSSRSRPSAAWFPFEVEEPMSERILRRTTTTVEEYLGAPCPPCATARADLGDTAAPAANDAPACAPAANERPAPEATAACARAKAAGGGFAHLIGMSFDIGDDDDLAGATCARPSGSTEDGEAPSCPRPSDKDGE